MEDLDKVSADRLNGTDLFSEESEKKNWVELFPYGITFDLKGFASPQRPVIFFKNKDKTQTLPVWLTPLNAGIALFQEEKGGGGPYDVVWEVLKSVGCQLQKCLFVDIKGYNLYVELHFSGLDTMKILTKRANEVIPFCLSMNARFYCQYDFIDKCRVLSGEESHYSSFEGRGRAEVLPHYLN